MPESSPSDQPGPALDRAFRPTIHDLRAAIDRDLALLEGFARGIDPENRPRFERTYLASNARLPIAA